MDLTHEFTVPAPIDEAWAAFNDLERIAPCFPGASLTSFDGEAFEGLVKVKLGPISLQYTGTGRFVDRDEAAHRAVIEAKGRDKRGNGTAAAHVTAELQEAGAGETAVKVVTDLNITGKPAQFGRGVMQDVSDKLLAQFTSCLETRLGAPEAAEEASTEAPAAEAPAAEAPAAEAPAAAAAPAAKAKPTRATKPKPATPRKKAATAPATPAEAAPASAEQPATTAASAAAPTAAAAGGQKAESVDASAKHRAGFDASSSTAKAAPAPEPEPVVALDLGATVLPVLIKRYAVQLVGLVVVLIVLKKLWGRRRS